MTLRRGQLLITDKVAQASFGGVAELGYPQA